MIAKLISYGALEMKPAHPIVVPTITREKYLENRTARLGDNSPMATYDFTWMWEELGVAKLRR